MPEVATAVVKIAPDVPTWLGCGPPDIIPPAPDSDLEANFLLVRDEGDKTLLLMISLDALYPGKRIRDELENGLRGLLDPNQIFLGATHTHAAPNLDETKPLLGRITESHLRSVSSRIVAAAKQLVISPNFAKVDVRLSCFQSKSTINRRRKVPFSARKSKMRFGVSEMLPNRKTDLEVSSEILEFYNQTGVMAAIWIFPCHPLAKPDPREISSDFVGDVRAHYRASRPMAAESRPFLFFQGASGDRRPPTDKKRPNSSVKNWIVNFFYGPTFQRFTTAKYECWLGGLLEEFDGAKLREDINVSKPIKSTRHLAPLSQWYRVADSSRQFTIHQLTFGEFNMLGVSAEPTWKLKTEILGEFAEKMPITTLIGCIDDTFGYLVTSEEFREGGYEPSGFLDYFSIQPRLKGHVGEEIKNTILAVTGLGPSSSLR